MNRTLLATILTVTLVAVPYGAWFVTGTSKIDQEGARRIEDIGRQAHAEAAGLAAQLWVRLDNLRRFENQRPFYDYQNLRGELRAGAEGAAIVPSPLASGPGDPLIAVYFQLDADGAVTLPTINEDIPDLSTHDPAGQRQWRQSLQEAAPQVLSASESTSPRGAPEPVWQLVMPTSAWRQIDRANQLYLSQRQSPDEARSDAAPKDTAADPDDDDQPVTIVTEVLHWYTLTIDGKPAPVALRRVATPAGQRVQGFVISAADTQEWLDGLRHTLPDVRLAAGLGSEEEVAAPLVGLAWRVKIDLADALAGADAAVAENRWTFVAQFLVSAAAAAIAAGCIIGIVWQSERLARQRSRFATLAAHELRTPLAGLQMYGEMLADGLGEPDNARAYARRITDEAQRLGRVVSNMLGFSRLERGTLLVRLEFGDLGQAVAECVEQQAFELEKAGAALDVRIGSDLPPLKFDRDAVGQIVRNLLDNAEKYSRSATDRTIHIRVHRGERGVALAIRDHGPGIDAHLRRHLFEPFTRGRGSDTPAGIGLGLTVTSALVKAHRGAITGENAEDGGAIFTVTFPT